MGQKKRVAVDYLRMNGVNLGCLNNITVKEDDSLHNVQTNIKMVEKLLNKKTDEEPHLQLFLKEEDLQFADNYLKEKKISEDDFVIGIHPGCATLKNHIKRRWDPEKFAQLSDELIKKYSSKILIFGGPEEKGLKEQVAEKIKSDKAIVIETDSLSKSSAIMKRCNLFVTNDSALMHIASALSLPVVAVIGPTNVNYIHPWKTNYKIASLNLDCAPCFFYSPKPLSCKRDDVKFKCIKELTVENVLKVIESFLSERDKF